MSLPNTLEVNWPEKEEYSSCIDEETAELKSLVVNYVGGKVAPVDDIVTLEAVIEVLADEFPELVLAIAEENFIRGYQQGTNDMGDY
tara:strand:- start:980 stop:1240 length:261 start_codon:yes stop_codon:yes gene_type:complete